jgi:SanA protein
LRLSTRRVVRRWLALAVFAVGMVVLLTNRWVLNSTDSYIYHDWALLPDNDTGVVLGTSPYSRSGETNSEFNGRIQAAAELYKFGKVKHLIVSGANPDSTYNEPRAMLRELIKAGVPESAVTMDFAGFRTYDSVVRAHAIFGLRRFTIVTQRYHAYRAVFIGKKRGLSVVAYVARARSDGAYGLRNPPREIFARVKAVYDVFFDTQPRFLGEPEQIKVTPEAEPT